MTAHWEGELTVYRLHTRRGSDRERISATFHTD